MLPHFAHSTPLSLLGTALLATATPLLRTPRATSTLTWGSCPTYNATAGVAGPFPVVCANFTVPLDWNATTATQNPGSIVLAVGKIAATTNQSLGTIFVNPGGPGGSGVTLLLAPQILGLYNSTGSAFDIVSWDPRGVGFSAPVDCFNDAATSPGPFTYPSWFANLSSVSSLQAPSSGPNQTDINRFNADANSFSQLAGEFYSECGYANDTVPLLGHVGSVATVRDLVALADAIDGPGKPINYYGYSYGSILGAYFINLFPQRVGRVVVDGVGNATQYTHSPPHEDLASSSSDTDAALQGFLAQCAESGPSGCVLATTNSTQASLSGWISQLVDDAYNYAPTNSTLSSFNIRESLYALVEDPTSWNASAGLLLQVRQALTAVMTGSVMGGNTTTTIRRRSQNPPRSVILGRPSSIQTGEEAQDNQFSLAAAVACGDTILSMYNASEVFNGVVNTTETVSHIFGPLTAGPPCFGWPYRAVERYYGPWDAKTIANPIVVIGNTADPVTPLHMAKELAKALNSNGKRNAALIQHDGYGHTSLYEPSLCTQALVRAYFINGTLPADTLCGVNYLPFLNGTVSAPTGIISSPLTWT